ncbi:MAG TPA: 2-phospho-L-lactate guanylyltransferase [Candidatus Limnocylindrales bacterium]|jgi:2-phospho-L-lactate guanylyltransferase|nr:2-phospho-L-lactate guanylyltransferase [Candidatus Limnocylindrales bacterium]
MPSPAQPASPRVVAIIPVGTLDGAKSRLGNVLDAEERIELTTLLARRTIEAAVATSGIAETIVVTPDDAMRALADELGARPLRQRDSGLNRGITAARAEAIASDADAIVVLPIDLPDITPTAIEDLLAPLADPQRPLVALVPDRHGRGTNALLIAPPDAIDVCFGGDSRRAHAAAANLADARLVELGGPLALDVDTPDDLLLAEASLRAGAADAR